MDFSLSEEQEMLKTMARDFLEKECPEKVVREIERDKKGYSPDTWRKIADLGWLGLAYPEKYGGTDGNILDMTVLYEEMGAAMFPSPYLSTVVLCGLTILNAGSEEQKTEFLTKMISGDMIMAMALTEPESSWDGKAWDAEGVTMKATADGDNYVIDGTKLFVHDAHIADYLLCAVRTKDGADAEDGVTLLLVDAKSPGITCDVLDTLAGKNQQCEVVFKNVKVPKKNVVGEVDKGWAPLYKSMQAGAVMLCAAMVGAGQKILDLTVDYAKTRIQFDMPIGVNQYVQGHCVGLVKEVDTSRRVTYLAAWRVSEGLDCDLEVAIAKGYTSEGHEKSCWYSHQVLAGVGSTEALGVLPLYTRRGKVMELYLGDTAYHMEKIAQALEKLPAPEKAKGKARGLWEPGREVIPSWDIWRDYYMKNKVES